MKSRGSNSTEAVADAVWQWVFTKYGSVYVDMAFCEKAEELLNEKWPNLKPWGKLERRWSDVLKNRFTNVRNKVYGDVGEATYKNLTSIPEVDLSTAAKRLIEEGLGVTPQKEQRSLYELAPADSPPADSPPAAAPIADQPEAVAGITLAAAAATAGENAECMNPNHARPSDVFAGHDRLSGHRQHGIAVDAGFDRLVCLDDAPSPVVAAAAAAPPPAAAGGVAGASAGALFFMSL